MFMSLFKSNLSICQYKIVRFGLWKLPSMLLLPRLFLFVHSFDPSWHNLSLLILKFCFNLNQARNQITNGKNSPLVTVTEIIVPPHLLVCLQLQLWILMRKLLMKISCEVTVKRTLDPTRSPFPQASEILRGNKIENLMRDMTHDHDGRGWRKVGLDWFEMLHHQFLHEKHATLQLHTYHTHTSETSQHAQDSVKVTELKTEGQEQSEGKSWERKKNHWKPQ